MSDTPDEPGDDVSTRRTSTATSDAELSTEALAWSVGLFVAFGVGFVFTLFLAAQFVTGGAGGGSGLFGGLGAQSGFAFAVLLSPFAAVLVGSFVARDDAEGSAVLDASVGSALGFVVMFFVTLVLAASLNGSSGGVFGVGPLVGFVVGTGITGAAAAFVMENRETAFGRPTEGSLRGPLVLGVGVFVAFAIGYAVTVFLAGALSGGEGIGLRNLGFGSVAVALALGLMFSPVVAVVVGSFTGRESGDATEGGVSGGVASGVGALVLVVLVYVLIAILQPSGVTADDLSLGPLVGFVVGTGITGAIAGYAAGR